MAVDVESQSRRGRFIGLTIGAIPGGFGQAGNDRIPRVIVGGGIGDECGHGEVSAIGQSDNADVVSRGGDAVLSAAGAGLVRDHGPSGQFSFEPLRARNGFGHQLQQ